MTMMMMMMMMMIIIINQGFKLPKNPHRSTRLVKLTDDSPKG